jgi:hypothetical protein
MWCRRLRSAKLYTYTLFSRITTTLPRRTNKQKSAGTRTTAQSDAVGDRGGQQGVCAWVWSRPLRGAAYLSRRSRTPMTSLRKLSSPIHRFWWSSQIMTWSDRPTKGTAWQWHGRAHVGPWRAVRTRRTTHPTYLVWWEPRHAPSTNQGKDIAAKQHLHHAHAATGEVWGEHTASKRGPRRGAALQKRGPHAVPSTTQHPSKHLSPEAPQPPPPPGHPAHGMPAHGMA